MSRYVSVLYFCDHIHAGRICHNRVGASQAPEADRKAREERWLFIGDEHFCASHRAEHTPKREPVRRAAKPQQPTLDDLTATH